MKTVLFLILTLVCYVVKAQVIIGGGSTGLGNTDSQQMTLSGNILTLDNGGTVDLSPYINTDGQTVTDFSISGNILSITLSGGNTQQVDLSAFSGTGDMPKTTYDADDNGSVDGVDDDTINSQKIIDGSVNTVDIQNESITESKISPQGANGQVMTIVGGSVDWADAPSATPYLPNAKSIADGYQLLDSDKNVITLEYKYTTGGQVIVPLNSTENIATGSTFTFYQGDTGEIEFVAESPAVVIDHIKSVIDQDGRKPWVTLQKMEINRWAVAGQYEFVTGDAIDTMNGLVASWREDDLPTTGNPAGNWTDRINGYIAVAKGAPQVQSDGASGKEVFYDGADDAHSVDANPAALAFTPNTDSYSLVVKLGSVAPTGTSRYIYKADGTSHGSVAYGIRRNSSNTIYVYSGGDIHQPDVSADNDLTGDILVATYSPTEVKFYQNGTLLNSFTLGAGTHSATTAALSFASAQSGTSLFTNFSAKDFLVFNKELSQSEINTIQSSL